MYTEVQRKGFTLIELLVVIAIIALLAAVVTLAINPLEILKRGRDSRRLSEMDAARKAVDLAVADQKPIITAARMSTAAGARATDNTGWISVDVGTYLSVLPIDPRNGAAFAAADTSCTGEPVGGTWSYRWDANQTSGYVIRATMESTANNTKCDDDGGSLNAWVEVGTDPGLCGGLGINPCANP